MRGKGSRSAWKYQRSGSTCVEMGQDPLLIACCYIFDMLDAILSCFKSYSAEAYDRATDICKKYRELARESTRASIPWYVFSKRWSPSPCCTKHRMLHCIQPLALHSSNPSDGSWTWIWALFLASRATEPIQNAATRWPWGPIKAGGDKEDRT